MLVALTFTLRHLNSGSLRTLVWAGAAGSAATLLRWGITVGPLLVDVSTYTLKLASFQATE
jgi:hypothetical protein